LRSSHNFNFKYLWKNPLKGTRVKFSNDFFFKKNLPHLCNLWKWSVKVSAGNTAPIEPFFSAHIGAHFYRLTSIWNQPELDRVGSYPDRALNGALWNLIFNSATTCNKSSSTLIILT